MLKLGDTIYIRDENRRVYHSDRKLGTGPIERGYWVDTKVVGETARSWITDHYGRRVPKKGGDGVALSEAERERKIWMRENAYKIGDAVLALSRGVDRESEATYEALVVIAREVEYRVPPPGGY